MLEAVAQHLYTIFERDSAVLAYCIGYALVRFLLRSIVRRFY